MWQREGKGKAEMECKNAQAENKKEGKTERKRRKEMVSVGLSKAEKTQEDGAHQLLAQLIIPASPCPSDQCFKIRKGVSHTKPGCFSKGWTEYTRMKLHHSNTTKKTKDKKNQK